MSAYFVIVSSSGFVDNIIMWDGTIEQWDTSSGFIIQDYYSYTGSFQFTENNERIINSDFINVTTSLDAISYTGSFTGSFTGSLIGTSTNASTASYVTNIKSGKVTSGEWVVELVGNNYTASVLLSSSYLNDLYAVSLTCGADIRTLSVTNKTPSAFDINSNSTSSMTDDVYWVTVPYNNA